MKLIELAKKFNYTCFWCHKKYSLDELSRDHWDPRMKSERDFCPKREGKVYRMRRGGSAGGSNIVLACKMCNMGRGNRSPWLDR